MDEGFVRGRYALSFGTGVVGACLQDGEPGLLAALAKVHPPSISRKTRAIKDCRSCAGRTRRRVSADPWVPVGAGQSGARCSRPTGDAAPRAWWASPLTPAKCFACVRPGKLFGVA